jgi:hypothetical protein
VAGVLTVGFLAKLWLDWNESVAQQERRSLAPRNPWEIA